MPKTKELAFKLANSILATNQEEATKTNDSSKSKTYEKSKFTWASKPEHHFAPLANSYNVILKTFLDNKIISLIDN